MSKAKDRFDFVETRKFKKFNITNFSDKDEVYAFDPTTATTAEISQVVATILKFMKPK